MHRLGFKKRKRQMSQQTPPSPHAFRVATLKQNTETRFSLRPDASALKTMAKDLELLGLRKLSFSGRILAEGSKDWRLTGKLGATVVQPCGVTLDPVSTRIDEPVNRMFLSGYVEEDAPDVEMPEDDTVEPLGDWIDPEQIMLEALVLALPLYPRSEGAALGESVFAEPGVSPMRDEDARPFAGLAALKNQLSDPEPGKD